jgi:tetratricopeptide (TPR) repeat protein
LNKYKSYKMKRILISLFILIFFVQTLYAQKGNSNIFYCGYGENKKYNNLCNYLQAQSFSTNKYAENAVDKILLPLGLPRNFVLISCPEIKNVVAITSKEGIRYIVYDNEFMESIERSTSNWSSFSILSHEIGHHLCGHTLTASIDLVDQQKKELEADEFSGFVMFKIGATLEQSQAAIQKVTTNNDDTYSTHPKLSRRIAAIEKGYNKAKSQNSIENIDSNPSAELYFSQGYDLSNQNLYSLAIDKYNLCIQINPNFASAYNNRGEVKQHLDNFKDAIADFTKAIQIDPSYAVAYSNRGATKSLLDDYKGAIADYNKAIQIDPNQNTAYGNRGVAKSCLNDNYGAIADLTKAIQINPNNTADYCNRGAAKDELKDYKGAMADYNKAIQIDPDNATAYGNRGTVKIHLKDYDGACKDFMKSCNLGGNSGCENYKKYCK